MSANHLNQMFISWLLPFTHGKMTNIGSRFPIGKMLHGVKSQYAKCLKIVWHIIQAFYILSSHSLFLKIWSLPFQSRGIFCLICTGAPHGCPSAWVSLESLIKAQIELKFSQIASNNDLQTCHGWLMGSSREFNLFYSLYLTFMFDFYNEFTSPIDLCFSDI